MEITLGLVREKSETIEFLKMDRGKDIFGHIAKKLEVDTDGLSFITMNPLEIGKNIMVITYAAPATSSKAGYNFAIHIYPMFGDLYFAQIDMGNDGNYICVEMSEDNKEVLKFYIEYRKKFELDNGGRQAIIDRINEVGKNSYLEDLNHRYARQFTDESGDEDNDSRD